MYIYRRNGSYQEMEVLRYEKTSRIPADPVHDKQPGGLLHSGHTTHRAGAYPQLYGNRNPPTCTEKGYTTYTCDCGDSYSGKETAATGHTWSDWNTTKEPTETAEGSTERICSACKEKETKKLEKLTHTHKYSEKVTAPTCTKKGYATYTCACGDSYTSNEISATGHSYSEWTTTKKATCTTDGTQQRSCSCGDTQTQTIAATSHSYSKATCTSPKTCSKCGATEGDALGHDYVYGTCRKCSEKAPTQTLGFGDSVSFSYEYLSYSGDFSVSVGDTYTLYNHNTGASLVDGMYVRIPIVIKNIGSSTSQITRNIIDLVDSNGHTEGASWSNVITSNGWFDDGELFAVNIRPNGSISGSIYIPYTGAGTYCLIINDYGSVDIVIEFEIF